MSDATTVGKSSVKLFFLEGKLIGVYALEISIKSLGSKPLSGLYNVWEEWKSPGSNTPHSSEGAAGVSLGVVHMEQRVQVRVQVECERRRGRRQRETRRKTERRHKQQTINRSPWMAWIWSDARRQTLEPMHCDAHQLWGVDCVRKMTCEVYLSTHPVGYSGSPSCTRNQL